MTGNGVPPSEPTSPVKPLTRPAADASPPPPPRELQRDPAAERRFELNGEEWVARLAGKGACGTGSYGLGLVDAVQFCYGADPDRPVAEALLAHGRFSSLFDEELARLLAGATRITEQSGS